MPETPLILAIDAGSFSVRCSLFGLDGTAVAASAQQIERSTPAPDWHEQNAEQIWAALLDALAELSNSHDLAQVAAVGLTNQRGSCLLWDKATGEPLGPAIFWSDRRMEPFVAALRDAGHALLVQVTTGAPLHSFYTAPKLRWMLDNLAGAGGLLAVGQLAGGTLDSWLLWKLSGGQVFATDYSNAQRTLLLNLATRDWEPELARLFSVPLDILPAPQPGARDLGPHRGDALPTAARADRRAGRRPDRRAGGARRAGAGRDQVQLWGQRGADDVLRPAAGRRARGPGDDRLRRGAARWPMASV